MFQFFLKIRQICIAPHLQLDPFFSVYKERQVHQPIIKWVCPALPIEWKSEGKNRLWGSYFFKVKADEHQNAIRQRQTVWPHTFSFFLNSSSITRSPPTRLPPHKGNHLLIETPGGQVSQLASPSSRKKKKNLLTKRWKRPITTHLPLLLFTKKTPWGWTESTHKIYWGGNIFFFHSIW